MKYTVLQPPYSMPDERPEAGFEKLLSMLDACDSTMDVIVLPEYSDILTGVKDPSEYRFYAEKHHDLLMERVKETAIRCHAVIFVNGACLCDGGYRNTTFAVDQSGKIIGRYFKAHPAPSEVRDAAHGGIALDVAYSYEPSEPYTLEIDGIRYGFLTCYDFYFYEAFARIARENVDVIIGCSLQRTDTHQALEIIGRFLSYNTNAYLVRASVSLGEDSPLCGCSMMVAPNGDMLGNLKSEVGILSCEFDPKDKYYKPAGFGGLPKAHYEYIEEGRRPWNYRHAGSAIIPPDNRLPYPRICAHQGFNTIAPPNSLPAYGAAVALGAQEIEFDLWASADGEIVSCHDATLERLSTGSGMLCEHTYRELAELDFGVKFGAAFEGLSIVRFEEILQKFACHTVMNIHVKPPSYEAPYPAEALAKIISLIRKYDCEKYVYLMLEVDEHIRQFKAAAPDIPVCVGHLSARPWEIVDRAIELGAEKVQLFRNFYTQEMIDRAHAHGIRCNYFCCDDPDDAIRMLDMGVDTILTNDYWKIANAVKAHLEKK